MSRVVIPNCTLDVTDPNLVPLVGTTRVVGNIQKDKRSALDLAPVLQGRGLNVNDHPKLYRVRIDLLPNDIVPAMSDKVFVATHRYNKALRGWFTIWDEPEQTSGLLATMVLSLHKEYN